MDIIRRLFNMKRQKPYKIQYVDKTIHRIGLTASSLKELRGKIIQKFETGKEFQLILEKDGTEIDDESYFNMLPEQTVFVVLRPGQLWEGDITYLKLATEKILQGISSEQDIIVDATQKLLQDSDCPYILEIYEFIKSLKINVKGESISDDPDWFEGVPKSLTTKEAVLRKSARERVRSYLNHTKDYIKKSKASPKTRKELLFVVEEFRRKLKGNKFYEVYFARSAESDVKFCNDIGWFECEGQYNKEKCLRAHRVNPYGSRDARVYFKTWNLDHRIEKSREILPKLIQAVDECPEEKTVDTDYFYDLLFTRENLRLVDVRCHVIASHDECKVDKARFYRKRKLK